MKKKLQRILQSSLIIFALLAIFLLNYWLVVKMSNLFKPEPEVNPLIKVENRNLYKNLPYPSLAYKAIIDEEKIRHLNLVGQVNQHGVYAANQEEQLIGITIRSLRYQNISRKVEQKYGLEKNILLAMVAQETGGATAVPNAVDDGGIGLCHMQPYTASLFGLQTYEDCKKLRSITHGRKLRKLIQKHNGDLKELIRYDDRFHPIKNLDAAGRMLAYFKRGRQLEDTRLKTAIRWYAGKHNYSLYYKKVKFFQEKFNDPEHIERVRKRFNEINPNLSIGGNAADFDDYIDYFHRLNRNYGLDDYR